MFDLVICKEVNDYIKALRKDLRAKGYIQKNSRTNCHIGSMHLNYMTEYWFGNKIMFEIERDLENNVVSAKLWSKDDNGKNDFKNIRLADIRDLC